VPSLPAPTLTRNRLLFSGLRRETEACRFGRALQSGCRRGRLVACTRKRQKRGRPGFFCRAGTAAPDLCGSSGPAHQGRRPDPHLSRLASSIDGRRQASSQELRHHLSVLGPGPARPSGLSFVFSAGSSTSWGLPILAVGLFRAAWPGPSAGSAELFAGTA